MHTAISGKNMAKKFKILVISVLMIHSCSSDKTSYERIAGFTQGTTYSIAFEKRDDIDVARVRNEIEAIFRKIDLSLSVYNDSSVISGINRNDNITPDEFFTEVFKMSERLSAETDGAFDITVSPLVKAWGFGPEGYRQFEKSELDSLLKLVGYKKVKLIDGVIVKDDPRISIDMNAIAQGYTVDVVYEYFEGLGMKSFLVEIGGEVRVRGGKENGKNPWKIGIDKPSDNNNSPGEELQAIVLLKDKALATSGNYRKFYIENGMKYSHTIDPSTGYPAKNRLLSATIITGNCAIADGMATACMVMGLEKAINYISGRPEYEAYFIYTDDQGNYSEWMSESLTGKIKTEGSD